MNAPRDVESMYEGDRCRVCGAWWLEGGAEAHATEHLATGEAVVIRDGTKRTERIVPTSSLPSIPEEQPRLPTTPRGVRISKTLARQKGLIL